MRFQSLINGAALTRSCGMLFIMAATVGSFAAQQAGIRIDCKGPAVELAPHLYGLFFEDINYAADGGLYAELVQNRSFEYYAIDSAHCKAPMPPMFSWDTIEREGAEVSAQVTDVQPLNGRNTKYLELTVSKAGAAGIRNSGFWGIPLDQGAKYDFSVFARTEDWRGDSLLTVTLETDSGEVCGKLTLKGAGKEWKQLSGVITSDRTVDQGRLVITAAGNGTLCLDMISLFPQDTFKGRKNGLRKDLVEALQDLNPKFLRFPGGCITHGYGLDNIYNWKDSVGPVEERNPNFNMWGYHQTYGLGFYEYFLLCEDLGMEPLPVVPVGVSCGFRDQEVVPMDELQPHIQDALDLIEFANGPAESKWGSVRAEMGHPKPFNMHFICLGNEEHDNAAVRERYPLFSKAVAETHPEIKVIGTSGLGPDLPLYDMMTETQAYSSDEHYYEKPEWFLRNVNRFDNFDRAKPKIFIGEYASTGNSWWNALAEAAYLTGVERNGDIVDMTCYAPLFARTDIGGWRPDLIFFNNREVMRPPNYYVQQLFAQNKGDVYLPHELSLKGEWNAKTVAGRVGIGTWTSAIEVKEIKVNGRRIDPSRWTAEGGSFGMKDGSYVQSDAGAAPAMSYGSEALTESTVVYSIRARKIGGAEGFLVRFGADKDGAGGFWWNLGGWGNSRMALEQFVGEGRVQVANAAGSIELGRWYDIRVVMSPGTVQCFLDDKLIHEYREEPASLCVSSTADRASGEVIVKLVNPTDVAVNARIELAGINAVNPQAILISISGEKGAVNKIGEPESIVPFQRKIAVSSSFSHTIPAMAVEFIRVKVTR